MPDLKNIKSKIGSTENLKYQPGGGKVILSCIIFNWKKKTKQISENKTGWFGCIYCEVERFWDSKDLEVDILIISTWTQFLGWDIWRKSGL